MNETLILGGIVLGLWLVFLLLRVPSSIAFLSLLIGQLLSSEAGEDVYDFVGSAINVPQQEYMQIALLLLPLLLTVLFLHGRVVKSKIFIEAIPTLLLAALTVILLAPLLDQLSVSINDSLKGQIDDYRSIVIVAASVSGLLSAWLSYPHNAHGRRRRKKHSSLI
jgi:hypothetical protein